MNTYLRRFLWAGMLSCGAFTAQTRAGPAVVNAALQTFLSIRNRILKQNKDETVVEATLIEVKAILQVQIICLAS